MKREWNAPLIKYWADSITPKGRRFWGIYVNWDCEYYSNRNQLVGPKRYEGMRYWRDRMRAKTQQMIICRMWYKEVRNERD